MKPLTDLELILGLRILAGNLAEQIDELLHGNGEPVLAAKTAAHAAKLAADAIAETLSGEWEAGVGGCEAARREVNTLTSRPVKCILYVCTDTARKGQKTRPNARLQRLRIWQQDARPVPAG